MTSSRIRFSSGGMVPFPHLKILLLSWVRTLHPSLTRIGKEGTKMEIQDRTPIKTRKRATKRKGRFRFFVDCFFVNGDPPYPSGPAFFWRFLFDLPFCSSPAACGRSAWLRRFFSLAYRGPPASEGLLPSSRSVVDRGK